MTSKWDAIFNKIKLKKEPPHIKEGPPKLENITLEPGRYVSGSAGSVETFDLNNNGSWKYYPDHFSEATDKPVSISYDPGPPGNQNGILSIRWDEEKIDMYPTTPLPIPEGSLENKQFGKLNIRSKVIGVSGEYGDIYRVEQGDFIGILKAPKDPDNIPKFHQELDFIFSHQNFEEVHSMVDLGIPLPDWKIDIQFVHPLPEANTEATRQQGWVIMEPVNRALGLKNTVYVEGLQYQDVASMAVPPELQLANIMIWLKALGKLKSEGLTMDGNVNHDCIPSRIDLLSHTIYVSRLDCVPGSYGQFTASTVKAAKEDFCHIVKTVATREDTKNHPIAKLDYEKIKSEVITDPDKLFKFLKEELSSLDWGFVTPEDDPIAKIYIKHRGEVVKSEKHDYSKLNIPVPSEAVFSIADQLNPEDLGKVWGLLDKCFSGKSWEKQE